jgi:hypothetical protein
MNYSLPLLVCSIFFTLALWHFFMALTPASGVSSALPSTVEGRPLFLPSKKTTAAVGVVLLTFAGLVASTAGLVPTVLSPSANRWLSYALAIGLLARAVGDCRYVGFFKRVRASRFAILDTFVYSPLCLMLAVGVAWVSLESGN